MVARRQWLVVVPAVCLAWAAAPADSAQALKFSRCADSIEFRCAAMTVPLDHFGKTPGRVRLQIAAQQRYPRGAGLLIALAGGPGQASVPFADQFAGALAPLLRRYRLVVVDQRGTGASGALSCPKLQSLSDGDVFRPRMVGDCAELIGPRRQFYSTRDSVADLDRVRAAFGARKVALMGVSYGT